MPERARCQLADLSGQLDPRGAGSDDDDREPSLSLDAFGGRLGHFEGAEDASTKLQRVVDGLHARRVPGELVVTEVRLGDSGGDDQAVVRQLEVVEISRGRGVDDPGLEIETRHLSEHHIHVPQTPHDVTDRWGDLTRRQHARRHLVEKWLKRWWLRRSTRVTSTGS